ncbi:hypothetical protein [Deinococcus misasensis]|uniref:hypothetical protein n=1 Tax=Deinococcus misasensis TaxID=392413 RepID=UPI000553A598|nr:hypothetical protein [Deinococcus misasensis]
MSKELTWTKPDDTPAGDTTNLGDVDVGTTTPAFTLWLKNTGTETVSSVRLRLNQSSMADGGLIGSVSGIPLTDDFTEFAATLDPGSHITVDLQWTVPPDAVPLSMDNAYVEAKFR